jgi:arabinofuranosyltransferase
MNALRSLIRQRNWTKQADALLGLVVGCLFLIVLFRNAWVGEEAYIGLRTVDNFVSGYGLTWNTTERVQAFTCPLWIFLQSALYFFTLEAYYTTVYLSAAATMLALALTWRSARATRNALLAITILVFSKAFMDFSTSGLENPLTHLLLAWFFSTYLRQEIDGRTFFLLSLIAGLGLVNRMDAILLVAPALGCAFFQVRSVKNLGIVALGLMPFFLWECFSLFYYGFFFPNTAYAKLGTGIP